MIEIREVASRICQFIGIKRGLDKIQNSQLSNSAKNPVMMSEIPLLTC
jgi:hypothetical protein